jgi:ribosomal protein S18 acetylase RimI-like enzyme
MIEQARGLNNTALEAIACLERRVLAADGGRLKLEWGVLSNRSNDEVRDILCWGDGRLLGFLGIYGFRPGWFEVTGMVDFTARRRGIARALFTAALPIVQEADCVHLLMVVPRVSVGGGEFARSFGMTYEHSEHALTLGTRPAAGPADPALALRQATESDLPELSRLYMDGFGNGDVSDRPLASDRSRTLMITRSGETVGTVALAREEARGAIYGFVVDSSRRGRGIGRQALRSACSELFASGASRVDLEVEVDNERALGLYTKVGFEPVATDDYYELLLSGPPVAAA